MRLDVAQSEKKDPPDDRLHGCKVAFDWRCFANYFRHRAPTYQPTSFPHYMRAATRAWQGGMSS